MANCSTQAKNDDDEEANMRKESFKTLSEDQGSAGNHEPALKVDDLLEKYFAACKGKGKTEIGNLLKSTDQNLIEMRDKNGQMSTVDGYLLVVSYDCWGLAFLFSPKAAWEKWKTGISWACAYNSLIAVKTLIKFDGTDLNTPDNEGNTPLMVAAQAGHDEIVRYFVFHMRKHIIIDAENNCGFTALMKAALSGKSNCARMLIISGADVTKRDNGKGLRADEWASLCGMHETAIVIKNVAKCTLTQDQKKELNWEKKMHPVIEFFASAGKYLRRVAGWDGRRWMVEAGSLYHLASHAAALQSGMMTTKLVEKPASNHYHHGTQRVETTTYCISQANHGEDILRVETTYETDQKQSLTRHTITQKLYDKPMRRTPSDKSRASVSWQVPDLQLITSSPVKQRKQPKSKIDRNLLVVPARQKKKSPD